MDLTESQWKCVEPLLPEMRWREGGPGRPPRDRRTVLNGILGVLRTGAPWKDLPDRYPSHQTCHRRFQHWCRNGTLDRILEALAKDCAEMGSNRSHGRLHRWLLRRGQKGGLLRRKDQAGQGPSSCTGHRNRGPRASLQRQHTHHISPAFEPPRWRKSPLFDHFLSFDVRFADRDPEAHWRKCVRTARRERGWS